jgi:hypothetical protein
LVFLVVVVGDMSGAKYKMELVALRGFDGRAATKPPTLLSDAGWGTHLGIFGGGCRRHEWGEIQEWS